MDVALNAILEIRGELEAVVAKFPDTTAKRHTSNMVHADGLSIQKIDAQVKYLQSEKALFQHRSAVLSDQKINQLVELWI